MMFRLAKGLVIAAGGVGADDFARNGSRDRQPRPDPYSMTLPPPGAQCPPRQPFPWRPSTPVEYNGIKMPDICFEGFDVSHIFIMGDYGGITCGDTQTRGPRDPNSWTCKKSQGVYVRVADNTGDHPDRGRYHVSGVDDRPQQLVAEQMRKRNAIRKPHYVLNGGDNFYYGGLDLTCCEPMDKVHNRTRLQFQHVFEKMYEGIDAPFFSVFGNHDFGGRHFNAAFDQQIAYTWASNTSGRWILPSFYWSQRVTYPKGGFTIDYFFVDTNKGDAKPFGADTKHNICGGFNPGDATCKKCGGPENRFQCPAWFDNLWREQAVWLEKGLNASTADWQIVVTHFPPDQFNPRFWTAMHRKYGIDLFVGSHRHTEEVHINDRRFSGLNWIVVGGGGGITSEWTPDKSKRGRDQYGFMDVTITKTEMRIEAINEAGEVRALETIAPTGRAVLPEWLFRFADEPEIANVDVYAIPTNDFLTMDHDLVVAQAPEAFVKDDQLKEEQVERPPQREYDGEDDAQLDDSTDYQEGQMPAARSGQSTSLHWSTISLSIGGLLIASGVALLSISGPRRFRRSSRSSREFRGGDASPESPEAERLTAGAE